MKKYVWILSIFLGTLHAIEEQKPLVIDSEFADFDGKQFTLSGHATIEHELGKVEAQNVALFPETESKKLRFAYLKMNEGVKITLVDGGELTCSDATVDYRQLKGRFWTVLPHDSVIYKENIKHGDLLSPAPLEVKSREMLILLQHQNQSSQLVISEIEALQDVIVNYNDEFFAAADQGQYQRSEQKSLLNPSNIMGIISLKANGEEGLCKVSNKNGDVIHADQIKIDTVKRELDLEKPKGTFFSQQNPEQKNKDIDFTCDMMTWNESQDVLTLSGMVVVHYKGAGTLTNPNEIKVYRQLLDGKKQISKIESIGESQLDYIDDKQEGSHLLTTYGKFTLDNQKMKAWLESPRDSLNKVVDGKQVHFKDQMGEVFADEAFVDYAEVNKKLTPTKLILKGNVYLLNKSKENDAKKVLQFAIADRVDYDPATQEMIFAAEGKKRVLFFDKTNNLQISAPAVKIKRNPNTNKESIQGVGDVRFSFIDKEFDQLKRRFKLHDDLSQKSDVPQ